MHVLTIWGMRGCIIRYGMAIDDIKKLYKRVGLHVVVRTRVVSPVERAEIICRLHTIYVHENGAYCTEDGLGVYNTIKSVVDVYRPVIAVSADLMARAGMVVFVLTADAMLPIDVWREIWGRVRPTAGERREWLNGVFAANLQMRSIQGLRMHVDGFSLPFEVLAMRRSGGRYKLMVAGQCVKYDPAASTIEVESGVFHASHGDRAIRVHFGADDRVMFEGVPWREYAP